MTGGASSRFRVTRAHASYQEEMPRRAVCPGTANKQHQDVTQGQSPSLSPTGTMCPGRPGRRECMPAGLLPSDGPSLSHSQSIRLLPGPPPSGIESTLHSRTPSWPPVDDAWSNIYIYIKQALAVRSSSLDVVHEPPPPHNLHFPRHPSTSGD